MSNTKRIAQRMERADSLELSDKCPDCGTLGTMEEIWRESKTPIPPGAAGWETEDIELKERCKECGYTQILSRYE